MDYYLQADNFEIPQLRYLDFNDEMTIIQGTVNIQNSTSEDNIFKVKFQDSLKDYYSISKLASELASLNKDKEQDSMKQQKRENKQQSRAINSNQQQLPFSNANLSQKRFKLTPIYNNLNTNSKQYNIYGDYSILFFFKTHQESPFHCQNQKIEKVEYFKSSGVMLLHFDQQPPQIKDFSFLIETAKSMGDQQYFTLSKNLKQYQLTIAQSQKMLQLKAIKFQQEGLLDKYEQSYKRFEEWAITEIQKNESHLLFDFAIRRFNLNTLELQKTKGGQSAMLMALRWIDIKDPWQYLQGQIFHTLDDHSNLTMINKILQGIIYGEEIKQFPIYFLTLDGQKIQLLQRPVTITNKCESYPYHEIDAIPYELNLKYDFIFTTVFYEISIQTLKRVIDTRQSRTELDNECLYDFRYSIQSQIFLEKFYVEKQKDSVKEQRRQHIVNNGSTNENPIIIEEEINK